MDGKHSALDAVLFKLVSGALFFFATWTLLCNLGVQLGMTGAWLAPLAGVALIAGLIAMVATGRGEDMGIAHPASHYGPSLDFRGSLIPAALIAAAAITFFLTKQFLVFWGLVTVGLGVGLWRARKTPPKPSIRIPHALPSYLDIGGLLLLTALSAAIVLSFQRPDADDANFLNLAVGAIYDPRPVLTWDTMIEDAAQVIHLPTYRVESLSLLFAAAAKVTGYKVITLAHIAWPVLTATLLVIAYALIARIFASERWLVAVALALAILLLNASAHASYGNFSLVRFQQGKGAAFTILVPLVYFYAVLFWTSGSMSAWLSLAACQVTLVGLTANGIYLGPLTLFVVLTACLISSPRNIKRYVLGGIAGFWPVAMGAVVLATTGAVPSEYTEPVPLYRDVVKVFGGNAAGLATLILFFAAWSGLNNQPFKVFLASLLMVWLWVPMNPFLSSFFADNVTGNLNFRLFYVIPFPILTGLCLTFLLPATRKGTLWSSALAAALLAGGILTSFSILNGRNGTHFEMFGLKVVPADWQVAQAVAAETTPSSVILAPEDIAVWLTSVEPPRKQIAVRELYMVHYAHTMSADDVALRSELLDYVSGREGPDDPATALRQAMTRFGLDTIVLSDDTPRSMEMGTVAAALGFVSNRLPGHSGWSILRHR